MKYLCSGSLNSCSNGVYPGCHTNVVHSLILLSDRVLGMNLCHFLVALLQQLSVKPGDAAEICKNRAKQDKGEIKLEFFENIFSLKLDINSLKHR